MLSIPYPNPQFGCLTVRSTVLQAPGYAAPPIVSAFVVCGLSFRVFQTPVANSYVGVPTLNCEK